jgi:putative ABC transport system permease protein
MSLPAGLIETTAEFYRPVAEPYNNNERSSRHLRSIGRLKKGITLASAQAELSGIASRLEKQYPDDSTGIGINLVTITEDTVGGIRPSLFLLSGAAGLVLLIACVNLANLLLARAAFRQREFAIRASLGAARWRLIRQLLAESALLAFAGGAAGILLANLGISALVGIGSQVVPLLYSVQISLPVLGFTILVSILSGIFFGMMPALQVSHIDLNEALKEGGRSGGAGARHRRIRNILVAVEVALAIILLSGAGLLIQSVARLYRVETGLNPKNVVTMNVWLPFAKYKEESQRTEFYHRMIQRVSALPGIDAAGTTSVLPFSMGFDGRGISIEGQPRKQSEERDADMYVVTPGYDRAIGIHLVRGRFIGWQDTENAPLVAVVNETFAKQIWPGEDAIGKRLRLNTGPDSPTPWRTVVGIVRDVKQYGLDGKMVRQFYLPQAQNPFLTATLVVRTKLDASVLVPTIRREILDLDNELPVFNIYRLEELMGNSISVRRLSMLLLGGFAFIALCLAIAGIYGVVSYSTAQRTQEIGVRMTLGARQKDVMLLVIRQGMLPAFIGAIAGLACAFGFMRLMRTLLFEVSPADPITLGSVTLLLIVVALVACYFPARRATHIDPLVALRYE